MSANNEDEKEFHKSVPLDLARSQITTVRTVEGKAPLMMSSQTLRGMRVLAQGLSSSGSQSASGPTIIATNIVPQVLKQEPVRTQITNIINTSNQNSGVQSQGNITLQRPSQLTLTATTISQSLQSGTTYHVPRGPAVVANLAAPRGNVASVRTPMIVTAQSASQTHSFVRPPRAPSPAQGTAWLNTNSSNGSQIKGAPTVLSSPVRGATVTGKPTLINRTQPCTQGVQTLRPATILHSAITIGQPGQIHSFKTSQGPQSVQTLNNTVSLSQVLPPRTQAIVYNASSTNQFIPARLTVASSMQNQRQVLRPTYVSSGKVTVSASQINSNRLINPQGTVLTPAARISAQPSQNTATRIVTTQQAVTINRLPGSTNTVQNTSGSSLGTARILHSIVAVANSQQRNIQTSGTKVITQATQGTIHLTPLNASIKTTPSNTQSITRTINVPAALVAQRPTAVVSSQTIPLVKAFPAENPQNSNVFIHTPNVSHRATPSPTSVTQTNTLVPATTVAAYTIGGGTYFYDASGTYSASRSFGQQSSNFTTVTQSSQPIRSAVMGTQVHSMVANPQTMRYNSVMVVEQGRNQQFNSDFNPDQSIQQTPLASRTTASPRPSILRKRDHEGNSLKVAKNLNNVLASLPSQPQTSQLPLSPPPRPDSRGTGNSSGGSTTISATSSPGPAEDESSMPAVSENHKEEDVNKPPLEMSPRKKPRKQQLTGNDLNEHNDDMQFISDNVVKKDDDSDVHSDEPRDGAPEAHRVATLRKPATASLLNSYKQNWKSTHNHFMRYSDVKPKEERKPTIIDLANQYRIHDRVNGWKVYHLSTQMDDMAELEQSDYDSLSVFLKCIENDEENKSDKDVNRISELIKGNLQRIKIIQEGILEAKSQMMKVFDHKSQVTDLINRCASKRNFKKREKL